MHTNAVRPHHELQMPAPLRTLVCQSHYVEVVSAAIGFASIT